MTFSFAVFVGGVRGEKPETILHFIALCFFFLLMIMAAGEKSRERLCTLFVVFLFISLVVVVVVNGLVIIMSFMSVVQFAFQFFFHFSGG